MITFRMRLRAEDNNWIPDHPGIIGDVAAILNDPSRPREEIRTELFGYVDANYPGMFTLEWEPDELRDVRLAEVTDRTRTLLRDGFSYASNVFASDTSAQAFYNLLRLQSAPLLGLAISYPIIIPTLDDASDVSLSAGGLALFLAAAGAHVRAVRDGDALLKRALRAATTVAAIQAVQDTR